MTGPEALNYLFICSAGFTQVKTPTLYTSSPSFILLYRSTSSLSTFSLTLQILRPSYFPPAVQFWPCGGLHVKLHQIFTLLASDLWNKYHLLPYTSLNSQWSLFCLLFVHILNVSGKSTSLRSSRKHKS